MAAINTNCDKSGITKCDNNSLLFNKRIWTIEDASKVTGFSKGTIYNKTSRREIPYKKRGGRLFFIPDEILDWIYKGD